MDTAEFFAYPTGSRRPDTTGALPASSFLEEADERAWDMLLSFMQTQNVLAGETVITEGAIDRALYLLTVGSLELAGGGRPVVQLEAPAPFNEIAFLDEGRCSATVRAAQDSECMRLSFDAFESLAMRDPVLARTVLLDLGRIVARALRANFRPEAAP